MKTEYDVIIMGGGGSGLAAAVSAAEHGLRVVLLERLSVLGGSTGIAVGSFTASQTSLQRRQKIEDSPTEHIEDAGKFADSETEGKNNAPLRSYFLSQAGDTYEWLVGMGLSFHGPSPEPPNRVPRMHNVVPNAKAYIAILQRRFLSLDGTIYCNANVKSLHRERKRVNALEVEMAGETVRFSAKRGIVLAAGDYANSKSLIASHKGEEFADIEGINPHSRGDGHRLVDAVGGRLINMEVTWGPEIRFVPPEKKPFVQLLPTHGLAARMTGLLLPLVPKLLIDYIIKRLLVTWQHPEEALFEDGAILINAEGNRFCNEREFPKREITLARQPGRIAYILLDKRLIERYSEWPHYISTAPEIAYAYVDDYLRLRRDVTHSADSLAEIARLRKIPVENLAATVDAFNDTIRNGAPDRFERSGDEYPLEGDRWVLMGPAKAYFTITEGGASINENMQVLDNSGSPIGGLYAVGCNGLGGQILFGHGLHIAWAMTSGRLVGKVLAEAEED